MQENKTNTDAEHMVDELLKTSPGYQLPDGFAEKLMHKFEAYVAWKSNLKEFLIYFAVVVGIMAITGAMGFFLMAETWNKWIDLFFANIGTVIGLIVLLIFILFMDKVLLRYFTQKSVCRIKSR